MKVFEAVDDGRRKPRVRTMFMVHNEDGDLVPEESKTVQSDVVRSEIKHVLAKYEQTGVLVGLRDVDLEYRDVSEFEDYADLNRQSAEAKQAFMRLPSKVREVFSHDVAEWLDSAHDGLNERQRDQLLRLGVLKLVEQAAPEGSAPEEESSEE